jgi:hypothetical protein
MYACTNIKEDVNKTKSKLHLLTVDEYDLRN